MNTSFSSSTYQLKREWEHLETIRNETISRTLWYVQEVFQNLSIKIRSVAYHCIVHRVLWWFNVYLSELKYYQKFLFLSVLVLVVISLASVGQSTYYSNLGQLPNQGIVILCLRICIVSFFLFPLDWIVDIRILSIQILFRSKYIYKYICDTQYYSTIKSIFMTKSISYELNYLFWIIHMNWSLGQTIIIHAGCVCSIYVHNSEHAFIFFLSLSIFFFGNPSHPVPYEIIY